MSLRNQPLRRGLIAGFAVTLFGSLLALGCVQGPKGAFNRVWGPESYAAKTSKAIQGLGKKETAVDEEKEKLADSKNAKQKAKKDALAQASGTKEAAKKGVVGVARPSKHSELASSAKKGDIAAPYVKKRNPKLNEVEDPFLKDMERPQIAANTRKPAPSTALNAPKPANAKPGVAFAKGFDTQLSQIKADVSREKALAEALKKKTEADAAAMAAARREVDALLTQARAADKRGNLDEAKKLAHTADELVASRKILLTAGAERPEDFLQKIREKQFALENAKKLEIATASAPQLPDDDGIELRRSTDSTSKSTAVALKEQIERPAKVPARSAAKSIEEEDLVEVEPVPRVQIKVQRVAVGQPLPRQIAANESQLESRPAARMTIQRSTPIEQAVATNSKRSVNEKSQIRETEANGDMIFDSHVVDWRFPIQNRMSPAASDYEEVQVSYEEVARRNSQRGRVTANGSQWSSSKEGRVRTNRGSVVNANGEQAATRMSRGNSDAAIIDGRILMSSHTVRDGQFAKTAGKRMTDTSAPELLNSSESEQSVAAGVEAKPAEENADSRASSSNGWSFLLGVAVAAVCAVGFAFRNRGQIEKPRS